MLGAQLKCNGTLEAVQLMRHGYPNRVPYDLMFDRYQKHLSGVRRAPPVHHPVPPLAPPCAPLRPAPSFPPRASPRTPSLLLQVPGIERLSASQFSEILVSIADLAPGDYALGLTKMFLKAGKGKFLEDLKDKPVDEAPPVARSP